MLQRYLVTYDIRDSKRLRTIFNLLKGFGDHLQLSVFSCDLSPMDAVRLKAGISKAINFEEDQVLIIDLGPANGRGMEVFESIGRAYIEPRVGAKIV